VVAQLVGDLAVTQAVEPQVPRALLLLLLLVTASVAAVLSGGLFRNAYQVGYFGHIADPAPVQSVCATALVARLALVAVGLVAPIRLLQDLDVTQVTQIHGGHLAAALTSMRLPAVEAVDQNPPSSNGDRGQQVDCGTIAVDRFIARLEPRIQLL